MGAQARAIEACCKKTRNLISFAKRRGCGAPRRKTDGISMSHVYRALTLVLLLRAAQQGALVHELGHFSADHATAVRVGSGSVSDGTCALCPSFAQAASPTFSHSFHIPLLVRSETDRSGGPTPEATIS